MNLIVCLAHKIRNAQLLQIHHRQYRSCQIVANGNHGTVEIPSAQRPQHFLVLSVTHHSVSHIVAQLLYQIRAHVHCQHLCTQLTQISCQTGSKTPQTNYHIGFHLIHLSFSQ